MGSLNWMNVTWVREEYEANEEEAPKGKQSFSESMSEHLVMFMSEL